MKTALMLSFLIILAACQNSDGKKGQSEGGQADTTSMRNGSQKQKPLLSPPDSASITVGDLTVKVTFGSPSVRGREIWDGLVPYNKVWRTGANEASTFSVSQDVMIDGKELPAGRYGLFTIPNKEEWVVILNKVWDQWGAFEYNDKEDILRFTIKPQMVDDFKERMDFDLEEADGGVKVIFRWEKLMFTFMINPA